MDAAALALNIDSSSVVVAAENLDRFSASAAKAGSASSSQSGSIAKLVATVQSMNAKLAAIVGGLDKVNSALASMAKASQGAAAANDNVAKAIGVADAHVIAYTQHLAAMAASQTGVSAAVAAADAHVIAYTQHLASLSRTQQDANAHVLAYQASLKAVPASIGQADAHVLAYRNSLNQVEDSAKKVSTAIKFTATDSLNASRQLADIGVTAAMGMSPFMIAIQQGPQLLDILQNKAAMTGQTLGAVFRAAAVAIGAALAPFLPLIAAVAVLAAGIAALTAQANNDSGLKKYTTAMGYTKAEVKKLNAVTVTFGDTFKAVFQVGFERIASAFGFSAAGMGKAWDKFLSYIIIATRATVAGIYALLSGMQYSIYRGLTNAKQGKFENPFTTLKEGYKSAYGDAQKFMDDVVKKARGNARKRQDEMAKGFYDAPKEKKGPKQFTWTDLLKDADKTRNDLTKQAAQIGLYGEALAKVTYEQVLLNKASEHGLKLSPQQKTAIAGIAAELAKLAEANRHATFMENFSQQTDQQLRSLEQARGAIGLTGRALVEYTYYQEQLNKALAEHINLTDADKAKILSDAQRVGEATYANTVAASADATSKAHNERMRQLNAEQAAIGLTGQALISYQYQQEMINKAVQDGVALADIDTKNIKLKGDAYAYLRMQVDQQQKAMQDAREVVGGFWNDFIAGARQGANIFKSFGDAVVNALNRVIDKLLDKTLDTFLNGMFQNGAGGFLNGLFGQKAAAPSLIPGKATVDVSGLTGERPSWAKGPKWDIVNWATGGMFGMAQKFAKGGSFTNQIISSPTLFRFAKGAKMGQMGEAGPEAIMPLKRGPNGSLGVQMHGGGRTVQMGDVHLNMTLEGAISEDRVVAIAEQAGQAAVATVRKNFADIAAEYEANGVVSA